MRRGADDVVGPLEGRDRAEDPLAVDPERPLIAVARELDLLALDAREVDHLDPARRDRPEAPRALTASAR